MAQVWAVPWKEVSGAKRYVHGAADAQGVIRASFRDALGRPVALLNVPDVSPPIGAVKFTDENGDVWGVPFESIDVSGPWQRCHRAVESIGLLISRHVGLPTKPQNISLPESATGPDKSWCDFGVVFSGCEQLTMGATQRFRLSGDASFTINAPILRGEQELLSDVSGIEGFLSWTTIGDVTLGTAYHVPFHRTASQWTISVRCPFRLDFYERPPDAGPYSDPTLSEAPAMHAAARELYALATAGESLPTLYDNAEPPRAGDTFAYFNVIGGASDSAEAGTPNRSRTVGVARAVVCVRPETGLDNAWRLVDVIANAFRCGTRGGVDFGVPVAQSVGRFADWWGIQVDCPLTCDRVRNVYV